MKPLSSTPLAVVLRWPGPLALLVLLAAPLVGCDNGPTGATVSEVEILHWWTAEGEKQAIDNLVGFFQREHPTETVIDTAVSGSTAARMTIQERMIGGQPPDTFQANGGWDLLAWVLYNNIDDTSSKMNPIDGTAAAQGWAEVMPKAVLDTVSFNGHIYAVPLNIHRMNTLFFNEKVFAASDVPVPSSLDDVFAAATAFQEHGITAPIALGTKDGTLPLLFFENLIVARAGGAYYQAFMQGEGDPFAPEIAAAVDDLAMLLKFSNTNSASLTWSQAVDRVLTGDAALTVMGDWAKGYMVSRQATPDVDFGAIPTPGTSGTFVFTTDTFGVPRGARNLPGALDLLAAFGSQDGQDTFNPIKGSISVRSDTVTERYDAMAQRTISDFRQASLASSIVPATAILARPAFMNAIDAALRQFVQDGDKSTVIHTLANYYDILQTSVLH